MNELGEVGLSDIYGALMDLKQGFGRVEASVISQQTILATHIEDDKRLSASIMALQTQHAEADRQMERRIVMDNVGPLQAQIDVLKTISNRQSGAIRAIAVIGTALGTIGGSLIAIFTKSHQ
ncbi:MAG: hypothetical protein ACLQFI_18355 [Methylocella sp.]